MIVANGCPKSGTHALMRLLAHQGKQRVPGRLEGRHRHKRLKLKLTKGGIPPPFEKVKTLSDTHFIHGHVCAAHAVDWARFITIIRDPRNVLVSNFRFRRGTPDEMTDLVEAMDMFCGKPFAEVYRGFLGWIGKCQIVRYEDLPPLSTDTGISAGVAGATDTWTGAPSDWREWWTERIERKWRRIGGPDLVAEAGYPEHDYPVPDRGAVFLFMERLGLR